MIARKPLVLLVEDDAALGPALKFTLELEGYAVELTDRAEVLMGRTLPEGATCLVTDQNLPGMGGLDMVEALRLRGVRVPAILITTQVTRNVRAQAGRLDVQVVEKPILGDRLSDAIRGALGL